MTTLTLQQAADFLKIHPVTLLTKAKNGEIPGAKIGKRWVFLEIDLMEHIRSQYPRRALQGEHERSITCHSSNAKTPHIGGSNSRPGLDRQYSEVLGLPTRQPPRSITTS
ncbi:MAG: helix-turn-helix domain-containing protein [Burkholderiales bacterium]